MTIDNWIKIISLLVGIIRTAIPYSAIFLTFWVFRKEIKTLIENGGLRVSVPGFSLETLKQQQEGVSSKEKKEIEELNKELETSKKAQQKLAELQEYTARDKDTFFLGYHFEKTYRLIFPSQTVILNAMNNQNGEITNPLAQAIFRRTIWAQHFNIPYEQFIGFLIQSGVAIYDNKNDKFIITPMGRVFLDYLKNNNIPLKLSPNDNVV